MQRLKLLSTVLILATFSAVAQAPAATTKVVDSIPVVPPKQTPALDEVNILKIQNAGKDMQIAQMQESIAVENARKARDTMQQLVMAIEQKYPGYTIDLRSGGLIAKTPAQDVPAVPAVEAPKAKK